MRHRTRNQLATPVPLGLFISSVATHSLQVRPVLSLSDDEEHTHEEEGGEEEGRDTGTLASKWEGKNRALSLEKLRFFDLIISTIRVCIKRYCKVDLNHFLLDLQPVSGGLQNDHFDALGV